MTSQAPYQAYIWLSSDPQKHVALKGDLQDSTAVGRGSACPLWVLARRPTPDTRHPTPSQNLPCAIGTITRSWSYFGMITAGVGAFVVDVTQACGGVQILAVAIAFSAQGVNFVFEIKVFD